MHARRTALLLLTNIAGALAGLVTLFFVGRFMSPASYGAFGFAMSLVGLWLILADFGFATAHTRFLTGGAPIGDAVATHGRIKLVMTSVFVLGVVASILVFREVRMLQDATGTAVLVAVLLYGVAYILRTSSAATLASLKYTASLQATVLVEHVVKIPLVVVAALFYGFMTGESVPFVEVALWLADHTPFHRPMTSDEGGLLLALAWAGAVVASLIASETFLARQALPRGRYDPALARRYVLFALPLALAGATRIFFTNTDALVIGWFLSAENVGYYFAADRLSMLALMIPVSLQTVFFPVFGDLAARGERALLAETARNVQRTLSVVMVLLVVFFVVFPAEGIRVFLGDPFLPSQDVLPILAVYVLLLSYAGVSASIVTLLGSPMTVARVGLVALAINLVLDLLLVPDRLFGVRVAGFHSVGAAVATATAQGIALILLTRESHRLTGATVLPRNGLRHLGAGAGTAIVLVLLREAVIGERVRVWELMGLGLVGAIVYGGALVALGELRRADMGILLEALHPRRMVAYIREEMRDKRAP